MTHQYLADAGMHGLLNVIGFRSGCGDEYNHDESVDKSLLSSSMETLVAPMENIDSCFICKTPLMCIDAKSPQYENHTIANFTDNTITSKVSSLDDMVAVTCGDWK